MTAPIDEAKYKTGEHPLVGDYVEARCGLRGTVISHGHVVVFVQFEDVRGIRGRMAKTCKLLWRARRRGVNRVSGGCRR